MESEYSQIRSKIKEILPVLNESLTWVNAFLNSEKRRKSNKSLIDVRRTLNKVLNALKYNPSAALYGESQVGKSYLIKNLLSRRKEAFTLKDIGTGATYDFLSDINPSGGEVEATSVVTRFSTRTTIINNSFPIQIKLLSPKDLALILIDSSFSELSKSLLTFGKENIDKGLCQLEESYNKSDYGQKIFSEDDIYDIEDYLIQYFPASNILRDLQDVDYWNRSGQLISKMSVDQWVKLLELIWGNNQSISTLFNELVNELQKMKFSEVVFCKYNAVLRKEGTLLNVNRLHQLRDSSMSMDAEIQYISNVEVLLEENGQEQILNVDKSYLCALVGELVFGVDEELKSDKAFLESLDLLDFPGARARKEIEASAIDKDTSNLLLRGKVAYIFNKYSEEYLISNLLFCNKSAQTEVTFIPRLLNNWISNYIGKSPEEREEFLTKSTIPPLFIIYTWFNVDLMYSSVNDKDEKSLSEKWAKRFLRIFENEIVTKNYDWDKNWTISQPHFQNQYMLRDLMLSEEKSNLFAGYGENKEEMERVDPKGYTGNYWRDLESSFLNFDFVQKHFENPEEVWQESATMNQDGTAPIIRNLNIASTEGLREQKFEKELFQAIEVINNELNKHYHSTEADKAIQKAIDNASNIQLEMDVAFGKDPYFFGKFIDRLLLREGEVFNFYHQKITDIELIEQSDIKEYAAIRLANPELSLSASFDENIEILRRNYNLSGKDQVVSTFQNKGIDLDELFYGNANLIKSNSKVMSDGLIEFWFEKYLNVKRFESFIENGISEAAITDLLDNIRVSVEQLDIKGIIARQIRKYVDRFDKIDKVQEMIADISTAIVNKYINHMGRTFYSEDDIQTIAKTNDENSLGLNFDHEHLRYEPMKEKDIEGLFQTLHKLDELLNERPINQDAIKNVPAFSHYFKWRDHMKLSFVATCDIPTYDVVANNELEKVIEKMSHM